MSADDEEFENDASLFKDPDDFYQGDKPPTFVEYTLADGKALKLRLVGHNPLWVRYSTGKVFHSKLTCRRVICFGMRGASLRNILRRMQKALSKANVCSSWELEQDYPVLFAR